MEPENPSGNGSHAAQFVRRDYVGDALVFDLVGAPDIPGQMVSEGTLLVLGLLAVFLGPGHPDLLLLDDLDRGLHPRAQQDLITLLRRLLEQHPEKQIVATTHSPFLLDGLNAQEIRLTTLREDGSVACGRLVEHAQFEKWKDTMTPGELWSVFGEKWVSERQAAESK
jgi:ABC-type multidrug transport system ATPase subunit